MRNTEVDYAEALDYPLSSASDYFALLKPRVMSLVVFTSLVGMILAPGKITPLLFCACLFAIALGSGAAGAFNMWYERDLDAKMSRTAKRPIPMGLICETNALNFSLTCGMMSIMILFLSSNIMAALLLALAMLVYGVIYTMYLKRRSSQNIVIGGLSGALPPLIGWASVTGTIALEPIIMVLIIFLWTPPHFWALSINKAEEYRLAGVPMLSNVKGIKHTKLNILIYSVILFLISLLPCFFGFTGMFYLFAAVLLGLRFVYLAFILYISDTNEGAMKLFGFSILYLFCLFSSLLIAKILSI